MADKVTASSIAASLTIGEIFAAEKHFGGKCLRRSKNDRREPMSPLEATVSMAWVAERRAKGPSVTWASIEEWTLEAMGEYFADEPEPDEQ